MSSQFRIGVIQNTCKPTNLLPGFGVKKGGCNRPGHVEMKVPLGYFSQESQ